MSIVTLIAAIGWLRPRPTPDGTPSVAFSFHIDPSAGGVISPDGLSILYRGGVRRLDSLQTQPVHVGGFMAWSPDSRSVAFVANGQLQITRIAGGAAVSVGSSPLIARGASWSDQGAIILASGINEFGTSDLYVTHASGGEAKRIIVSGLKPGRYYYPEFLPGGEDILFSLAPLASEETEVYLAKFRDDKISNPVLLFKNDSSPRYTPAAGGRIVFVQNDNLYSQKLDLKARTLRNDPELIAEHVSSNPIVHFGRFSVSRNGVVIWRAGGTDLSEIVVFSRDGKRIGTVGAPSPINSMYPSLDETRFIGASESGAWLFERDQPGRLSLGRELHWLAWSPDGTRLLGSDGRRILERAANGSGGIRELTQADNPPIVSIDVSSDGKALLLCGASSINSVRLDGSSEERVPKLQVQTNETARYARFSPDARWFVYPSLTRDRGGGIYVQPFPGPGLRKQIATTTNGFSPVWRADGKEILYYDDGHIWAIRVDGSGNDLRFGPPEARFPVRAPLDLISPSATLAVSRDGSRIYFLQPIEQPDSDVVNVRMGVWK